MDKHQEIEGIGMNMHKIDLSIIIPVYNAMPLIERALDSVFGQRTNYKYEVILVDDGSSDDSVSFIENYRVEKSLQNSIQLIRQPNAGPAIARNNGVSQACGRYCAYLDADDYWTDEFVENVVSFLDSHQECVAVSVGQRHMTVSGSSYSPNCINEYSTPIVLEDFWLFWGNYMHVCTGSVCIRTGIVKEIGGQRTDLRVTEDLEFWAIVGTYGKWGFIPELLFVSDGTELVNDNLSWLRKMQPRWNNAPSVRNWQKRIVARLGIKDEKQLPEGFKMARGRIASTLVYGQIVSGRQTLARKEVIQYGVNFPNSKFSAFMKLCSHSLILWWGLCKIVQYRELHRFK